MEILPGNYAKIWPRILAHIIDTALVIPFGYVALYFERQSKFAYLACSIFLGFAFPLYDVYFNARWGQTLGKMFAKIKIVTPEFRAIGLKESFLRSSVNIGLAAGYVVVAIAMVSAVSDFNYAQVSVMEFTKTLADLNSKSPLADFESYLTTFAYVWVAAGILAVITSRRRQAVHDLMAGTVVVSTKAPLRVTDANKAV